MGFYVKKVSAVEKEEEIAKNDEIVQNDEKTPNIALEAHFKKAAINVVDPTEISTTLPELSDNRTELHVSRSEVMSDKSPVSFQVRGGRLRTVVDPRLIVSESDMRQSFAAMTPDVVNTLGQLLTHFDARIRLAACMQILDRAWGKPTAKVNVSTTPTRNHIDTSKWTVEERAQARALLEKSLQTATVATQELQGDTDADLPTEIEVSDGRTQR